MANYSITSDTTYYVNSGSGSDVTGDGSVGTPWRTLSGSISQLRKQLISPGITATLSLADGTYTGYSFSDLPFQVKVLGNQSNPAATYINTNSDSYQNATVSYSYVKLWAVNAVYGGIAIIQTGSILSATSNAQIYSADGGIVRITGNYSCQGSCAQHMIAEAGSLIMYESGLTLTISGTPNYTDKFAVALRSAAIRFHRYGGTRLAFSGTATGVRYGSYGNSVIDTNGGGASYLPGNSAGGTLDGGIYI